MLQQVLSSILVNKVKESLPHRENNFERDISNGLPLNDDGFSHVHVRSAASSNVVSADKGTDDVGEKIGDTLYFIKKAPKRLGRWVRKEWRKFHDGFKIGFNT